MSPDEAPNPFQRGTGSYPPVLAGRQAELTALHRLLSGLANGTLEQTIHLMQAPRGLGKTVLLQALQRDASVRVEAVDVRRTSAGVFVDIDDLAQLIEPVPGLLSLDESIEALHVPQWQEWKVEEPVLEEVAADCLGYPFFLQLWGEQLWEAGRSRRAVDAQAFHAARTGVDAVRTDFYAARFDEFERFGMEEGVGRATLLAAVQRIAPEISEWKAAITTRRLDQAMEDLGLNESQVAVAKRCFIDNGFLTRHGDDWQAAIPPLATYIQEHPR